MGELAVTTMWPRARLIIVALVALACSTALCGEGHARPLLGESTCSGSWYCEKHTATMTAFAFGKLGNASGTGNWQGSFANHPPRVKCKVNTRDVPDPSANWPWMTKIKILDPPVFEFRNRRNQVKERTIFKLTDNGDPDCVEGLYWADIYHGRWLDPELNRPCSCGGVEDSVCVDGTNGVDNCRDARVFGKRTVTYIVQLHR